MSNIAIFGDSIASGLVDEEGGGWVKRLERYFYTSNKKDKIFNFSISGDDTEELLKRFKMECLVSGPNKIIFAVGINDSIYLSLKEFKDNLNVIMNQAKEFTKDITFIGLTNVDESKVAPIPWNTKFSYNNKDIKEFNDVIRDIAKKNKFKFIDLFGKLKTNDLYDGLHPNSSGHKKIFEAIKNKI